MPAAVGGCNFQEVQRHASAAPLEGHRCFKIVLGPALAVPGLPGGDVVSRSGIGSADLIMK
jgi:hypothetical protein